MIETMNRRLLYFFTMTLLMMGCSTMTKKTSRIRSKDVPNLKPALYAAIGGNVSQALADIDQLDEAKLSAVEKDYLEKYKRRFGKESTLELSSEEQLVGQVMNAFHSYWKKALLQEINEVEGYKYLFSKLEPLALTRGYKAKDFSEEEFEKLADFLKSELKRDGYYSLWGHVKPFLNLMVWEKESEKVYSVDIGEPEKQDVKVVFMDDFKELGWGAFATLEIMYVGGWAKSDKLFCVKPAYDVDSETFRVSYLAHEGRHFSDYKLFPKIDQVDLEYRAKLTEIVTSDITYKDAIDKFILEGKNDKSAPHAYASYLLVRDLNKKLKSDDISSHDKKLVQKAAKELIDEHTEKAQKKGAANVQTLFYSKEI